MILELKIYNIVGFFRSFYTRNLRFICSTKYIILVLLLYLITYENLKVCSVHFNIVFYSLDFSYGNVHCSEQLGKNIV